MTDDATLSDFVPNTDDEEADSTSDGADEYDEPAVDSSAGGDSRNGPGDVEFSTFASGDYQCFRCDETTGRVWREEGELVCPNCKKW
ncbi:DUF7573 domain-containing protein [Natrinema gelatinilyticum]|uniref:DUF7573 domain-containing protein n=1 Tax=Natrinema gelatinilyticum TaxID=2961571 RepID=UPI0020C24B13|nr:hypothetical protein [Natrinema gelatinilyticum]